MTSNRFAKKKNRTYEGEGRSSMVRAQAEGMGSKYGVTLFMTGPIGNLDLLHLVRQKDL